MKDFTWFRAASGLYDLYEGQRLDRRRVARIARRNDLPGSFYRCELLIAPFNLDVQHRAQPKGAVALVERWVSAQFPTAAFTRDNF